MVCVLSAKRKKIQVSLSWKTTNCSLNFSSKTEETRTGTDSVTFTPLKIIINADFSNRVELHKDLHHYVPQNQLIDMFSPPKRYGSTQ